jgi:hypothetical protein
VWVYVYLVINVATISIAAKQAKRAAITVCAPNLVVTIVVDLMAVDLVRNVVLTVPVSQQIHVVKIVD